MGLLLQKQVPIPSWRTQRLSLAGSSHSKTILCRKSRYLPNLAEGGRDPSKPIPTLRAAQSLCGADNILGLLPPPASHGNTEHGHPAGARNLCKEKQQDSAYKSAMSEPLQHREAMARTGSVPAGHSVTATPDSAPKEYRGGDDSIAEMTMPLLCVTMALPAAAFHLVKATVQRK